MPRQLRIEYPGAIYHLMNRGDRREQIFKNDFDRKRFVTTLKGFSPTPASDVTFSDRREPSQFRSGCERWFLLDRRRRRRLFVQISLNFALEVEAALWLQLRVR